MVEETFEGCESTSESTGVELKFDFRDDETSGFRLVRFDRLDSKAIEFRWEREKTHFENISRKIIRFFDLESNPSTLVCNSSSRLDFGVPVSTIVTVGRHENDILLAQWERSGQNESNFERSRS